MNDRLIVILCTSLIALTFAEYHVNLQPVYNENEDHTGYALKLTIGSPEKEFTVLLDTVSKYLWVVGIFSKNQLCGAKTAYSNLDSYTCTTVSPTLRIENRGPKSVTMLMWNDHISISSSNNGRLNFTNSSFGTLSILNWPEIKDYQQIDGVFGLSIIYINGIVERLFSLPSSSNISNYRRIYSIGDNPLREAIQNKQFDPIITIALPSLDLDKTAVLTLGGRNDKLCDLKYEKNESLVNSKNRYNFEYLSIKMGNATYRNDLWKIFAYPHTVKSYIRVPHKFMEQIVRNLKAEIDRETEKYMVDCNESFEPFVLQTRENNYTIESKHFIIKHDNNNRCELAFRRNKNILDKSVALGIPFFHKFCVTLEPRDKRINFAPITQSFYD
ncbi:Aspartic protease [Dirofilaria immitis]